MINVSLQKIQEYCHAVKNTRAQTRRGARFFNISIMQKTQKKHGGVLVKLYLMTKNTFALEYLNNFARFNTYAQNFFYAIAIFQSNYDYTCEPLTC